MADAREVLRQIEGPYLIDYALFTGALREYVVRSLEPSPDRRLSATQQRLFLVTLFREEYSAYEDLGAVLHSLLTSCKDPAIPLLEPLLSYRPGEVQLARVFERHGVSRPDDLYDLCGFERLVEADLARALQGVNVERVLRLAARFFFVDCAQNQRPEGVRAFNKMKHGLLWVPSGRSYVPHDVDGPAALFATQKQDPNAAEFPFTIYTVRSDESGVDERLRVVHFVQVLLRFLAALRVVALLPSGLAHRGIRSASALFAATELADVVEVVRAMSDRESEGSEDAEQRREAP